MKTIIIILVMFLVACEKPPVEQPNKTTVIEDKDYRVQCDNRDSYYNDIDEIVDTKQQAIDLKEEYESQTIQVPHATGPNSGYWTYEKVWTCTIKEF